MIFRDDGWKVEVEMLEDLSDTENESYKLKVVKTITENKFYKPLAAGVEFKVSIRRNFGHYGRWYLSEK